jgi:hypothetical protein
MFKSAGIDLAGFSGTSALAYLNHEKGDSCEIAVISEDLPLNLFTKKPLRHKPLSQSRDAEVFQALARCASIFVDIPIDLQNLANQFCESVDSTSSDSLWQLTRRPVDLWLGGMPPLADRIGAPVTRMNWIQKKLGEQLQLGENLYEAYPAGSLKRIFQKKGMSSEKLWQGYKGGVVRYHQDAWAAEILTSSSVRLAQILNALKKEGLHLFLPSGCLNDHEFDATLCALTSLNDGQKTQENFDQFLSENNLAGTLPRGFRLLSLPARPLHIKITHESWQNMKL